MIPPTVTQYCATAGVDLTPIRQLLLDQLWQRRAPTKAYDLLEALRLSGIGSPKPPTVYRAIDFLAGHGLVHKVHALNAYVPCHHPGRHQTCQFLICERCGHAEEFCDAEIAALVPQRAAAQGFRPRAAFLEVFGSCRHCADGETPLDTL